MSAVSPGTIAVFQPNEYYPTHEEYLEALSEAMRPEYEAIVARVSCCRWIARTWGWAGTSVSGTWTTRSSCAMPRSRWKR